MLLLLGFAFLAGVVTVLSPCILPVLPVVLSSALGAQRWRPLGIVTGLVASFAFFTLALTSLVSLLGVSPDALRLGGAVVIGLFGVVLAVPALLGHLEAVSGRLAGLSGGSSRPGGYWAGALVGASLGLVWAPCAGPILAAITTLVATNRLSPGAVAVTLSYGLGVGVPMLLIAYGGRRAVSRIRSVRRYAGGVQRAFGVLMVAFAGTFFLGVDRTVEAALVQSVPPEWTSALTSLEARPAVQTALASLAGRGENTGAGPQAGVTVTTTAPAAVQTSRLPDLGPAPELRGIVGWVNGQPVTLASLRGKVVLVDFWTYSCINCVRTLPYVTQWDAKYRDAGLVVVGVHTPEFEFEKSHDNVVQATRQYGIKYLVAQDNSYATWQAFHNLYWPAEYLIDAQGHLRYTHFGEGHYDVSEAAIRDLLAEAGASADKLAGAAPAGATDAASGLLPEPTTATMPASPARTPETYLGSARQQALASPERVVVGARQRYSLPGELPLDRFALSGEWTVDPEMITAGAGSGLDLEFLASDVYLVLTPSANANGMSDGVGDQVMVTLDGRPIADAAAGEDIHGGVLAVTQPRLYHLVDLRGMPGQHELGLRFLDGGTQAYAFTFG